MANEMRTFVTIVSDKPEVATRLQEIFKSRKNNYQVDALDVINNLTGTSYCYKDEKENFKVDEDFPSNQLWEEFIGSKWMNVEYEHDEMPNCCNLVLSSAWSVPVNFLSILRDEIQKIDPKCYIVGTYEDESFDPCGAFVYGEFDYDDIEDYDEEYDWGNAEEDDFYTENWQEQLIELKNSLEKTYLECLEEKKYDSEN